ncbi:TPA: hypothetical protein HA225_03670 [Candidatus Micrarchaeota archaeon]|nr:hypothetical protein [Candidatus Micrarchaeota archaeon]
MVNLPARTTQVQPSSPKEEEESMLSFVPKGMPRSIAEYLAALLPGSILLFAFFVAAEVAVIFLGEGNGNLLALSFLPVICIMPILSGVVSTLVLEKVRNKQLSVKRGAMVGAAAGFVGAFVSVILLSAVALFADKYAFGSALTGVFFYVALLPIIAVETVLGALGGAAVVKVIKEA